MKRWLKWLLVLLLLTIAYIIIGISLINHSKSLLEGGEVNQNKDNGAPTQPFYDGMNMLSNMRWMPYYGSWAEEIMDVHLGPFIASYVVDYHSFHMKNSYEAFDKLWHERDSIQQANHDFYLTLPEPEYPDTDFDGPLPADDQAHFCEKWKRFEQLLKELNEDGAELNIYGYCQ